MNSYLYPYLIPVTMIPPENITSDDLLSVLLGELIRRDEGGTWRYHYG